MINKKFCKNTYTEFLDYGVEQDATDYDDYSNDSSKAILSDKNVARLSKKRTDNVNSFAKKKCCYIIAVFTLILAAIAIGTIALLAHSNVILFTHVLNKPCPKSITIDSVGGAVKEIPKTLGTYNLMGYDLDSYPLYRHEINDNRFLYSYSKQYSVGREWTVGNKIGENFGYIKHRYCNATCPNDCDSNWKYGDGKRFHDDDGLRVMNSSASCCDTLVISSKGVAKEKQSLILGQYQYLKMQGKNRVYKQMSSDNYMFKSQKSNWLVYNGTNIGKGWLGHYHCDGITCPENCLSRNWEIWDKNWKIDQRLKVSCVVN